MVKSKLTEKQMIRKPIYEQILRRLITNPGLRNVDFINLLETNGKNKVGLMCFYTNNLERFELIHDSKHYLGSKKTHSPQWHITELGVLLLTIYDVEKLVKKKYEEFYEFKNIRKKGGV